MPVGQLFNNQTTFSLFLGDAVTMNLSLIQDAPNNGVPVDLTSCTEIGVFLPNADGTISELTLSGGAVVVTSPAVLGQFKVSISTAVSLLLNEGVNQTFSVTFTIGANTFTIPYSQALSVYEVV